MKLLIRKGKKMATMIESLIALHPTAEWEWQDDGTDYAKLNWLDEAISKPSEADINNKKSALESAAPMVALRAQRDEKLAECDWRASSDVTLDDAWKTYRVALRDLPSTSSSPTLDSNGVLGNVTWPVAP